MKQADSFLAMQAACSECGEVQEVDFADEYDRTLNEWTCESCKKEFTYCHPENQYGLTSNIHERQLKAESDNQGGDDV